VNGVNEEQILMFEYRSSLHRDICMTGVLLSGVVAIASKDHDHGEMVF
jgi:hypothetical protein